MHTSPLKDSSGQPPQFIYPWANGSRHLLLIIDVEMSDLDATSAVPLEIALVVVDRAFNIVDSFQTLIQCCPTTIFSVWANDVFQSNGLLRDLPYGYPNSRMAEQAILSWLSGFGDTHFIAAGNTIWKDLEIIQKHLPGLFAKLSPICNDISSLEQVALAWSKSIKRRFPRRLLPAHRAMTDALSSLALLKFLCGTMLMQNPHPGPNSEPMAYRRWLWPAFSQDKVTKAAQLAIVVTNTDLVEIGRIKIVSTQVTQREAEDKALNFLMGCFDLQDYCKQFNICGPDPAQLRYRLCHALPKVEPVLHHVVVDTDAILRFAEQCNPALAKMGRQPERPRAILQLDDQAFVQIIVHIRQVAAFRNTLFKYWDSNPRVLRSGSTQ